VVNLWLKGDDSVNGGAGVDRLTVTVTEKSSGVWLQNLTKDNAGGFKGTFNGDGSNDITFAQIERFSFIDQAGGNDIIITGRGRDLLKGGAGNDMLDGAGGNDRLFGQEGNDTLKGGLGVDLLFGGLGNDTLTGAKGKDVLVGGEGDDVMTGGRHADTFEFNGAVDEGLDTITDFRNGVDLIRVHNESFNDLSITSANGGNDTQITFVSGTVITLEGVAVGTIHANDFDIV
jgi:Ca2+-binding RTX toxin-like protein